MNQTLFSAYFFLILPFLKFIAEPTKKEEKLFQAISTHYFTEESTKYLANVLLKNDDWEFIAQTDEKSIRLGDPVWTRVAYFIILKWAKTNGLERITLLRAMEKTNAPAANFFRMVLTSGEF